MRALLGFLLATQVALPCLAQNFALRFDGTRRGASLTNPMTTAGSKFTWEAWVQPGDPSFIGTVFLYRGHYHDKQLAISSDRAGFGNLLFHVREGAAGGGSPERNPTTTVTFTPGDWIHLACSYDGVELKIFMNGRTVVTESAPFYNGHMNWTDQTFGIYIGTNLTDVEGPPFFRGAIDEVRAWSVARTEAELRDNMHRHIDGPEEGLVGAWSFDEGEGQLIRDGSGQHHDGFLGLSAAAEPSDPLWAPSTAPVTYSQIQVARGCGYAPMDVSFSLRDPSGLTSVAWDFGDGTSSAELNPTHTYTPTGSYKVRLTTVTTSGEELTYDGRVISVGARPEAHFRLSPPRGAAPLGVQFTDESVGDVRSRLWEFGDGATSEDSNPQHTYQAEGNYEVRLTVRGNCQDSIENESTHTDTVDVGSLPAVELVPAGPRCVALVLTNARPVKAGEVGISYDPGVIRPTRVRVDSGLPPGAVVRFQADANNLCAPESGVAAGFTVGWINSLDESIPTAPGRHRLLTVCFELSGEAEMGSCSPLSFVQCLGVPGAPVRNIVTEADGHSTPLFTSNGEGCVLPQLPFRRGDANLDGNFDISDAVSILGCLFLGTECALCQDAADGNDDGLINISDPVYLLNWRFSGGVEPPSPFLQCGVDPTSDELDDCEVPAPCP